MTDATANPIPDAAPKGKSLLAQDDRTKRRNAAEKRFRAYGVAAISVGLLFLVALLWAIINNGTAAFTQTFINLDVELVEENLDPAGNRDLDDIRKVSTFVTVL